MKKSDIAAVALIAGFATIIAFVLANVLLGDPNEESVKVQYLDVISKDLASPDEEVFNAGAINPTVETYVGSCKNDETWDSETSTCVSNEPASSTGDENGEDNGGDEEGEETENGTTDEPNAPEE